MARVGSSANAPWWHLKNGNALYGRLLNVYERPDERAKSGKSKFFQIELTQYADPDTGEVHDFYFDTTLGAERPTEVRIGRGNRANSPRRTFEVPPRSRGCRSAADFRRWGWGSERLALWYPTCRPRCGTPS
jgi:hypothetical protein